MAKKYGYARVSPQDQEQIINPQMAALRHAGCTEIYTDNGVSGSQTERPGLNLILQVLQPGDALIVWKLDRLGQSLQYLISLVDKLQSNDVYFVSLTEGIDTSKPGGNQLFHLMTALAEFERSLLSERTRAGMALARASGKRVGKPRALSPQQQQEALQALREQTPLKEVAQLYGVHPRTIRRLQEEAVEI